MLQLGLDFHKSQVIRNGREYVFVSILHSLQDLYHHKH